MKTQFVEVVRAIARPTVLIDAVHAASPGADVRTGEIVRAVGAQTGCHAVIGLVSRRVADLNRPRTNKNADAIDAYRDAIRRVLEESSLLDAGTLHTPFLHLAIHGMADRTDCDVEVGTRHGRTCSPKVAELVVTQLEAALQRDSLPIVPKVIVNQQFIGDMSKGYHRHGDIDTGYAGFGNEFNTVQIEFANWLRTKRTSLVVRCLVDIVEAFDPGV